MGILRKLASQTAVYGLSSMLGRFINFLLVIPHTEYLKTVGDYGDVTAVFAFMAFLNIILTYGMETSFFNFIRKGKDPELLFSIVQKCLLISTFAFALLSIVFAEPFAAFIGFPGKVEYVYCCLIFLTFDTISVLPFAKLRYDERPLKFAMVKLLNILVNIALNLLLLTHTPDILKGYSQVTLILIANAVASICSFLVLSPMAFRINKSFDFALFKQIIVYAWPLVFVGLAGIVNETLDRTLIKRMLPPDEGSYQNGIYGAFYKLTMVMTMFVQAFRFAAEPIFFKQNENEDTRKIYAKVMYWFIAVCSCIFLSSMFFIEDIARLLIRDPAYFEDPRGLAIVPVLLMANMFLGVYYNLSIWYRFTDNTRLGAIVAVSAAVITIVLNIALIPQFGFVACAWITFGVYFFMSAASFFLGKIHYPVPYDTLRYTLVIVASIALWKTGDFLICHVNVKWLEISIISSFIALMLLIIWLLQPKQKFA